MKNQLMISTALLLGLTGCVSHQTEVPMNLSDSRWTMSADYYQIADIKLPAFSLEKTAKAYKISGTTGCNSFFSSASWDGQQLTVAQPIAMTRMMCTEMANKIEMEFISALEQALVSDNGNLRLSNGAIFKRVANN